MWLLICSYYFYMSWNPKYAILIGASTLITFLSGILIEKSNRQTNRTRGIFEKKLWIALSFISNLAILFFFKYFHFAVENIHGILEHVGIVFATPTFDILLPVGISFYTFQALGYTVDVYRGEIQAEKNPGKYALFVSFFPQLVAGPIERSKNLLAQVSAGHGFDFTRVKYGLLLMLWGLTQKVLIADRAALVVNTVYDNYPEYGGAEIVIATVLFAVQIYCDFSGYSDIAIGSAKVLGIDLMENFRRPYLAVSVQDFWRRWHISLSTWFRDYLYIPLGGGRGTKFRKYRNVLITFLVSGLWHGAQWNFVAWGGLHGFYLIIGDILAKRRQINQAMPPGNTRFRTLGKRIGTFALICFAWIFFRAPGVGAAIDIVTRIFSDMNVADFFRLDVFRHADLGGHGQACLFIGCIVLIVCNTIQERMNIRDWIIRQRISVQWIMYLFAIFGLMYFAIYFRDGVTQQFIYFQF